MPGGIQKMEGVTPKETISSTVETVSDVSYAEKKDGFNSDAEINKFLDHILELRTIIDKKTAVVNNINDLLDKIFSLNDLNEECLKLLNVLIGVGRDFYFTLEKQYQNIKGLAEQNIAFDEINTFKETIDYLIEMIDDIECVFLILPKDEAFLDVTKKLSML
jgi:hypothetical protein